MANSSPLWKWSAEYQDYYYVLYDAYQRPVYHWSQQSQAQVQQAGPQASNTLSRQDSVIEAQMPEPAPGDVRTLQGFIPGTPNTGWYDQLDSTYRMRSGHEAKNFFKVGKVFAMLYTETASDTSVQHPNDDAYTVVRFGQSAHTNIRRFVVVEVRRGFVNACGIGTYSGRGALKDRCNPAEHTIVYFSGTDPASCYIPGEWESGMTKEPIEVVPVDTNTRLKKESRIRFGKVYPIEMNVKVKDIGRVRENQISALLAYWSEENHTPTTGSIPFSSNAPSSNTWPSGGFSSQRL